MRGPDASASDGPGPPGNGSAEARCLDRGRMPPCRAEAPGAGQAIRVASWNASISLPHDGQRDTHPLHSAPDWCSAAPTHTWVHSSSDARVPHAAQDAARVASSAKRPSFRGTAPAAAPPSRRMRRTPQGR